MTRADALPCVSAILLCLSIAYPLHPTPAEENGSNEVEGVIAHYMRLGVELIVPEDASVVAGDNSSAPPYDLAFRLDDTHQEFRLWLHPIGRIDTVISGGPVAEATLRRAMSRTAAQMTENERAAPDVRMLSAEHAAREFNGELGAIMILEGDTPFFGEYRFAAVTGVYHAKVGIMFVHVLTNELGGLFSPAGEMLDGYPAFRFAR
jgi:hypothetical protein